ncbi:MAG: hypothetical protein GPJ54_08070 [Candidatus Heimdallarchaeota archaeon]|nr:hypothetical protein [Candidatus Heimdallarchaeota archaeon]
MHDRKLPFIILAGSPDKRDKLMEYADVDYKAQIIINGKSMLTRTLEAIRDTGSYSYIVISGIPKERVIIPEGIPEDKIEFFLSEGGQMDKIIDAAIYLVAKGKKNPEIFPSSTYHAVNLSGDIPALTGEILNRFIDVCGDRKADFNHTTVEKSVMDKTFPNNGRSFTKIDKRFYCTGDLNMTNLEKAESLRPVMRKISANRKNFMKALFRASPWTFTKLALKRVKTKDIERLMGKIFKMPCKLVISEDAEVAFDVDKPFQLDIIKEFIEKRELGN